MTDSVLDRYSRAATVGSDADEAEVVQDCGAFGFLRGIRDRAIMLELRKKDGSIRAFGYGWLQAVEFDPSGCVSLMFPGHSVKIIGSNLGTPNLQGVSLLSAILRHRATFVQEADQVTYMGASKGEAIVEQMEW